MVGKRKKVGGSYGLVAFVCQRPKLQESNALDELLNTTAAAAQLSTGLALLEKFVDKAGEPGVSPTLADVTEAMDKHNLTDAMYEAFSSCSGLEVDQAHVSHAFPLLDIW